MKHLACYTVMVSLSIFVLGGCATTATTVDQSSYAVEESYVVIAHSEVTVLPTLTPSHQAIIRHYDAIAYAAVVQLRRATQEGLATLRDVETATAAIQTLSDAIQGK
jgi:hypothetical protein